MILLTPGPCMTPLSVRAALMADTENHRTIQGAGIYTMLRDRLIDAFPGYVPAILPATGTAAVESMIVSCTAPDSRTLILANGYYSERTGAIAEAHRMPYDLWKGDWFAPLDQEAITKMIRSGKYSSVVVTHHETSTSRLNDLGWLGDLQSEIPFRLLVDAVSSVGADELGVEPDAFCIVPN